MEGVHTVIHVASPFNFAEFTKYEDFIEPVKSGTKALLEGAKNHNVKRLIVTSSSLTLTSLEKGQGAVYDENDFTKIGGKHGYPDSKVLEEQIIFEW